MLPMNPPLDREQKGKIMQMNSKKGVEIATDPLLFRSGFLNRGLATRPLRD